MRNFVLIIAVCVLIGFAANANAQDCANGRCKPVATPIKNIISKMNNREVFKFEFKMQTRKQWECLRPRNWFKRCKRWGCK